MWGLLRRTNTVGSRCDAAVICTRAFSNLTPDAATTEAGKSSPTFPACHLDAKHVATSTISSSSSSGGKGTADTALPTVDHEQHRIALTSALRQSSAVGVFRECESDDIELLVNHFSAPALARALRERETTLQIVASLLERGSVEEAVELLLPYRKATVEQRRVRLGEKPLFRPSQPLSKADLINLQGSLQRMPRQVFQGSTRRASVVLPLCNVHGVASVLFQLRSDKVSKYKRQACFPGGMVDDGDASVVAACLRELYEESGIQPDQTEVLGILRCNWSEVANLTGVAVTPVVGYVGELSALQISPNPDEVDQYFSVPLSVLLDDSHWVHQESSAPVFTGGPHVVWGLTAYIMERFLRDIVKRCYTMPSAAGAAEGGGQALQK